MNSGASGLLGLLGHLQNLETSFSSVLMEAALKLAALSESSIFILVETAEGRRFAGKGHLCDAYNRGSLANTGADLELEIDPNAPSAALRQKPPPFQFQSVMPMVPSSMPNSSMSSQGMSSPAMSSVPQDVSATPHSASRPKNGSRKRTPFQTPEPMSRSVSDSASTSGSAAKRLKAEHSDLSLDFDDSIIIEDDDDDDGGGGFSIGDDDVEVKPAPHGMHGQLQPFEGMPGDGNSLSPFVDGAMQPFDPSSQTFDTSWIENEFMVENKKMDVIRTLDASADLSKDSVTRKILNSALHDLGKLAAKNRLSSNEKEETNKVYLPLVIDRFCNLLENFDQLKNILVDHCRGTTKFKQYCKLRMSSVFHEWTRRLRKKL